MGEEIAGKPSLTSRDHANPNMEQLTIMSMKAPDGYLALFKIIFAFKAAVSIGNILGKFFSLLSILHHTKNFTTSSEIQVLLAFPLDHDASLDLVQLDWCWINRGYCEQSSAPTQAHVDFKPDECVQGYALVCMF